MSASRLTAAALPRRLVNYAKKRGYKMLGYGADKTALLMPDGKLVVVCYSASGSATPASLSLFHKWINYCHKHALDNHLPLFGTSAISDIDGLRVLMVKSELLFPLPSPVSRYFSTFGVDGLNSRRPRTGRYRGKQWEESTWKAVAHKLNPFMYEAISEAQPQLFDTMFRVLEAGGHLDGLSVNAMCRRDGTIVINDPWTTR